MNRPPYPARVVAGLLVTTVEETRKLPTRVLTFPMSAVSSGLQAAMRLQQNIAELAIKGDEVLSPLFDKAEEQPAWATFDEDEDLDAPAPESPVAESPVADAPVAESPAAAAADTDGDDTDPADADETVPAAAGRFALYSAPPADVAAGATAAPAKTAPTGPSPEVVADLDYDSLTLAQLRAKVRTLDVDALRTLADYERGNRNRAPFVTMIDNRVASHEKKADTGR